MIFDGVPFGALYTLSAWRPSHLSRRVEFESVLAAA